MRPVYVYFYMKNGSSQAYLAFNIPSGFLLQIRLDKSRDNTYEVKELLSDPQHKTSQG